MDLRLLLAIKLDLISTFGGDNAILLAIKLDPEINKNLKKAAIC